MSAAIMSRSSPPATAIVLSFAIAIMLTLAPLPDWAVAWRPEWVALTLIYWVLTLPRTVGVGAGWLLGLLMDAAQGTLLGAHALGFAIIAYITLRLYPRLRWFPLYQQAVFVGLMLLLYKSAALWINGIQGYAQESWLYWAPVLSSMVLWPSVSVLLQATVKPVIR
ncbi:MAG: rod shape-determining protein MreD [Gammaproteobacteria bacterium]